jgi:hypothetical protein
LREERKRSPGPVFQVLQDAADMRVQRVHCERESCTRCGVGKQDGSHQRGLCCRERFGGGGGPVQCFWIATQEVREWPEGCRNFCKEPSVKIDHPEELLQLFDRCWLWKFLNGRHTLREWRDTRLRNHVAEEFHRGGGECALCWVSSQAVILEYLEKL